MDESVEKAFLKHQLYQSVLGPHRVTQRLPLQGVQINAGGVKGDWEGQRWYDYLDQMQQGLWIYHKH